MPHESKLTKKQKKGIAFRERKGKTKAAAEAPSDIPELEVQDELENTTDGRASRLGKEHRSTVPERSPKGKKRKRIEAGDGEAQETAEDPAANDAAPRKKTKKRKKAGDAGNPEESAEGQEGADAKSKRFILFVGNLPYTISKEQIQEHFVECNPAPSIRLLTPKPRGGKPQTAVQASKSKGCAFLEFASHGSMQVALKKHHSELAGRRINVELTAGGGGNSDQRKEKLRVRNRTLNDQRKKSAERRASKNPESENPSQPPSRLPIRHSTTSGATDTPNRPRTWSIPTAEDEAIKPKKTRGKSRGANAAQKKASWAPSGANAITVG